MDSTDKITVDHGKISNNHGGNGKGAVKQQNGDLPSSNLT
jgi:hypothetical protein